MRCTRLVQSSLLTVAILSGLTHAAAQVADETPPNPANAPVPFQEVTPTPENSVSKVIKCPDQETLGKSLLPLSGYLPDTRLHPGVMPPNCAAEIFPGASSSGGGLVTRGWGENSFEWVAPGLAHRPLYFDDVPLERYGQSRHPVVQPFVSAGRFFGSVPLLPYKMRLEPCHQPICTLGYARPGDCVPPLRQRLPFRLDAAVVEAGFVSGMILLIP